MEKLGFCLDDDSATCDQQQINRQESRLLSIQRCIKDLKHACQCGDTNCRLPSCHKMKRVVQHAKSCKLKTNGGCPICRQLIAICCYHAKHCQEDECPVSYCTSVKLKIKRGQLQRRLQEAQILKRRIASMQNRMKSLFGSSLGNSDSSNQPSPGAQPDSSPYPPQPDIGMELSTGPPVGALQDVQQVQAAAAGQTPPHNVAASVTCGKVNPVASHPFQNTGSMAATQQMQAPVLQMMSGVPNHMLNMGNEACWEGSGNVQVPQPHQNPQTQPNPQLGLRLLNEGIHHLNISK